MPAELLTSKLFIPPLRPSLVPRPRLLQLLNEGLSTKRKLTLISAPAGFGKTTLVVDWLRQIDHPTAWLSLDEADNDLRRFLAYLAAAFHQLDEEIGASLLSALRSPQLPAIDQLLTALLNEIAIRADSLILVLDDYHLITEAAILEAMGFLLNHQPPQLHLVLTTREDPDLPLARLRARDQLTEIRARDLRLTREEADIFLRGVMGLALSEQDVAALEGRTEGWLVGLQLAGLSMQKQTDLKAFIADFSGSHRHILDYLTDEVLQGQPQDVRSFLLQTAILDRLSGSLCDALIERTNSGRVLAHLEAANLFVIPLDEERRWYRYHHLFSDLLRNQLARSQPQLIPELHRRASRWYEANGDIQDAVDHALQDTDLTQAANLIEKYALPKLYQGQVTVVLGWFDRLPEAALESAPMLCIFKAWALAVVVTASVIISLALSPVFNLTTELIVGSAPPERAGAASGISETGAELGGALGIAILGSLGTAVYRNELANHLPAGVPFEAEQIARETLGAAVIVAEQLPDQIGLGLLAIARDAFVQGLHLAAAISSAIAIGAAVMAVTLLRHVPARSESERPPEPVEADTATITRSGCGCTATTAD